MAMRTWITLAALASLLTLWLQRRQHSLLWSAGGTPQAVDDHTPVNTMSPVLDAADGLARGRTDDRLTPAL